MSKLKQFKTSDEEKRAADLRDMIAEYVMPTVALSVVILAFVVLIFAPGRRFNGVEVRGVNRAEVVGRWTNNLNKEGTK